MPPSPTTTFTRVAALTRVFGQSGRQYIIEQVLQEKPGNQGGVYLARCGDQKYVLTSVAPHDFKYFNDMLDHLRALPHLRVSEDAVPGELLSIYKYLQDHFLSLVQKDVSLPIKKRILQDALRGIATLHEKGIVHTDIKPNNILIQCEAPEQGGDMAIKQFQVADIEDAT